MKMFVESMYAKFFLKRITEQTFEYFDYLAYFTSNWACTRPNNVIRVFTFPFTQHVGNLLPKVNSLLQVHGSRNSYKVEVRVLIPQGVVAR